jgi:hypothetical protein
MIQMANRLRGRRADWNERIAIGIEELGLSNSMTATALAGLVQEPGIVSRVEFLARVHMSRDRKKPR